MTRGDIIEPEREPAFEFLPSDRHYLYRIYTARLSRRSRNHPYSEKAPQKIYAPGAAR
jgi:hypothetical protein